MNKPSGIHDRIKNEKGDHGAQVFGSRNSPYFRYDPSHHLRKQTVRAKLTRNLKLLLLAVGLIGGGLIGLFGLSFSSVLLIMAILAIAVAVLILISR